jgi:hypothetical protein
VRKVRPLHVNGSAGMRRSNSKVDQARGRLVKVENPRLSEVFLKLCNIHILSSHRG